MDYGKLTKIVDNSSEQKEVKRQMKTKEGDKALNALRVNKNEKGALKQAARRLSPNLREAEQGLQELLAENGLTESEILGMIGNGNLAGALEKLNAIGALDLVQSAAHNESEAPVVDAKDDSWYGTPLRIIWHGEWADPELTDGEDTCNYWDVDDALWGLYQEETGSTDEAGFDEWMKDHSEDAMEYFYAACGYRD